MIYFPRNSFVVLFLVIAEITFVSSFLGKSLIKEHNVRRGWTDTHSRNRGNMLQLNGMRFRIEKETIIQDDKPRWYVVNVKKGKEIAFRDDIHALRKMEPRKYRDIFEVLVPHTKTANSAGKRLYWTFKKSITQYAYCRMILGPETHKIIKNHKLVYDFVGQDTGIDNANRFTSSIERRGFVCPLPIDSREVNNMLENEKNIQFLLANPHVTPEIGNGIEIGDFVEINELPYIGDRGFVKGVKNNKIVVQCFLYDESLEEKRLFDNATMLRKVTDEEIMEEKKTDSSVMFPDEILLKRKEMIRLERPSKIKLSSFSERDERTVTKEEKIDRFRKRMAREYKGPKLTLEAECERQEQITLDEHQKKIEKFTNKADQMTRKLATSKNKEFERIEKSIYAMSVKEMNELCRRFRIGNDKPYREPSFRG